MKTGTPFNVTINQGKSKIAIVHDYLVQRGGGERVVSVLHEMFPEAPIFTLLYDKDRCWSDIPSANVVPLMRMPKFMNRLLYRALFFLYPWVIQRLDLSGFDIVISSSSAYAKGVVTKTPSRSAFHLCYCHTPMRQIWEPDSYLDKERGAMLIKPFLKSILRKMREWDLENSNNVDCFIANSNNTRLKIKRLYGAESRVIYPPVRQNSNAETDAPLIEGEYFLVVSRLVPYKRLDLAIMAAEMCGAKLILVGEGPDRGRLTKLNKGSTVLLGWQDDGVVKRLMMNARALIVTGEEDFGMAPVEANLLGCPVIAFGAGGALETVVEGLNGLFFNERTAQSLRDAMVRSSELHWDREAIMQCASQRFGEPNFKSQVLEVIRSAEKSRMPSSDFHERVSSNTNKSGIVNITNDEGANHEEISDSKQL